MTYATREQLLVATGVIKLIDRSNDAAWREREERMWRTQIENRKPTQQATSWHTSFHASVSPLDDIRPCGRYAMYTLMGIPPGEPFKPENRAIMEAGKAIEHMYVKRWWELGILLSAPPWSQNQTVFIDSSVWISASADAIIIPLGLTRPVPVEIKGKDHDAVVEMQKGIRYAEPQHISQLKTYTAMAALAQPTMERLGLWPKLDPIEDGYLMYVSRARPRTTCEFRYTLDLAAWDRARQFLKLWRDHFLHGILPPRPKEWRWTEHPCQWCQFKKHMCRPDERARTVELANSAAIDFATQVDPDYSYQEMRREVLARWKATDLTTVPNHAKV